MSPYRKTAGSSSSRSFAKPKPTLPPLRRAEQRWGGPAVRSKDATTALARIAASCQNDHTAAIEAPISIRDLLHRKNARPEHARPEHARHELPRMAMSAPSAALLARDAARPRKPSSAPLCRRPTASRVVALRKPPPVPAEPSRDAAIGRGVGLVPTTVLSASTPPLVGEAAAMERTASAALLPVLPDGVERPAPIELPADEQQPQGLGSGGSPMSPDLCLLDDHPQHASMDEGFSPAVGDSPMCGIFSSPSPRRSGSTTATAVAPDTNDFSPPMQRPPPPRQQSTPPQSHSPPTVARARSLPAQQASTLSPGPLLSDFSPPVLRPPSRLVVTRSPAPSSPTEDAGSGKVSLVYDPILDCYFDPVSHRYFELR